MIRHSWQVVRLREVLAQVVECIVARDQDALDAAIAQAALVLRATDAGDCAHRFVHDYGRSWCRKCGFAQDVDAASPADLAREAWDAAHEEAL